MLGVDRNHNYVLLLKETRRALVYHAIRDGGGFINAVVGGGRSVSSQLLNRIDRGPLFQTDMVLAVVRSLIFRVQKGRFVPDFAQIATDILTHYIVNHGTAVHHNAKGEKRWKTFVVKTDSFFLPTIKADPFISDLYRQVEAMLLPSSGMTLENKLEASSLTFAVTYCALRRAALQKQVDAQEHARRVGMAIGVVFAALNFAAGASPIPLLGSGIQAILGQVEKAILDRKAGQYSDGVLAAVVDDRFLQIVINPARLGRTVPGYDAVTDEAHLADGHPIGDALRRSGEEFVAQVNGYVEMLKEQAPLPLAKA